MIAEPPPPAPPRLPPRRRLRLSWSDPRLRALAWQAIVVAGVAWAIWALAANTHRNLESRHIATGFGFLAQSAAIPIGETLLPYTATVDSYGWALLIGVLNTLRIAVAGVVLATVIGTVVGIGRLSGNALIARLSAVYVEVLRDLPVLLQLLFWYGVLQTLPGPRAALHPLPGVFLSNRGIRLPWLEWNGAAWAGLAGLAAGVAAWVILARVAAWRREAAGAGWPAWPVGLLLMLGLPVAGLAACGATWHPDLPALRGFNFTGGLSLSPEYAAMLIGLVTYTSSYIAEIVRSGLQAVAPGQWEAAAALGLPRGVVLRRVALPQALRVIIPPLTSEYLNLVKNSSLSLVVGYQDVVSIADTTLNQTGQSIEGVAIIMAVFLTFSLGLSLLMNWYNARIALVER